MNRRYFNRRKWSRLKVAFACMPLLQLGACQDLIAIIGQSFF
jgi:hypothetical protein